MLTRVWTQLTYTPVSSNSIQIQQYALGYSSCPQWTYVVHCYVYSQNFHHTKGKRGEAAPLHDMKAYRGVEVQLHSFLTSALDEGKWSTSRPGCFTPKERTTVLMEQVGWVGPRTSLNVLEKNKISCSCRESNPGSTSPDCSHCHPSPLFLII